MPHRRYDGNRAVKDRLGHFPLIERPQVFYGTTTPAHYDYIHRKRCQRVDAIDDTRHSLISLHNGGIENHLYIRIPAGCDLDNIPHRRTCRRCHNPQCPYDLRYGPLIFFRKHTQFGKLSFQLLKTFI